MELYYVVENLYLANQHDPQTGLMSNVSWEEVKGVAEPCVSWERRAKEYQNSRPQRASHVLGPAAGYEAARTWYWATAGHSKLLLRLFGALSTLAKLIDQ